MASIYIIKSKTSGTLLH